MAFRFLHTSDWQIGRPFRSFPERIAAVLEHERIAVLERVAAAARENGASDVLVAGDVFDADLLPVRTALLPIESLRRLDDLTWHLISGNHDPWRAGGLWEGIQRRGLPANVRLHHVPAPVELAAGAWLLPAPLTSRSRQTDPTEWMVAAATPEGAMRIGLAHGAVATFGAADSDAEVIAVDRARRAGLDYLALGDWHGTLEIDARTWYSGTPEPDRFRHEAPGQALGVTLAGRGSKPAVAVHETGRYRWLALEAAIASAADLGAVGAPLADLELDRTLARITLRGRIDAATMRAVETWSAAHAGRFFHLEVETAELTLAAAAGELADLGQPGSAIRRAAERLGAIASSASEAERERAELALAWLVRLAATAVGGRPR
jgi:DNA repair exonuclease SbcCD nuclease subunit